MILIFSIPRREQKKTNHLLNTESYIDVFYVPYILFLKSISPFHVCINTWPKNYNLSWEKVFFKESIHLAMIIIKTIRNDDKRKKEGKKKKKLMFPRSLFTDTRKKNIFFLSVFQLMRSERYRIERLDFTFFLKHSIFFPSCLFSLVFIIWIYLIMNICISAMPANKNANRN